MTTTPTDLRALHWPEGLRVLVLAPHPDDFDGVAATMALLRDAGATIDLAVLTGAASGVDDAFCEPPTTERKVAIREAEQRASGRLFGLPDDRLCFAWLREDDEGHPVHDAGNVDVMRGIWERSAPDLVFLPHPDDTNAGHRRTYRMFREIVDAEGSSVTTLLNEDPKTNALRRDAYCAFDDETAAWKAELLRCHRSQHQRNIDTRGFGLDERILSVNRAAARALELDQPYAETFEIESFGRSSLLRP